MKPLTYIPAGVLALCYLAGACSGDTTPTAPTDTPGIDGTALTGAHPSCTADVTAVALPTRYDGHGFDRYYELVIDGHIAMKYIFQPDIRQAQIEHIVRTTRWYLTDVPGSLYGADKAAIISTLAANDAHMVIPNGTHVEGQDTIGGGQELYFNETAPPGSAWYVSNDPEHRDATLEEVFHQVHDNGIGTNNPGALPHYQAALLAGAKAANADGRWASNETEWIAELTEEGSLAQEYIASVIDNYYGLWAHDRNGSGYYAFANRADVIANDPVGTDLLRQFLGEVVEVEAYLDPTFTGTFVMTQDDAVAYSHQSQYLRGARLTGSNAGGITGNELDNTLRGNSADNALDGAAGTDTAIYCNASTQYSVAVDGDTTTVTGPDGTDTLSNIETIHFPDKMQNLAADTAADPADTTSALRPTVSRSQSPTRFPTVSSTRSSR